MVCGESVDRYGIRVYVECRVVLFRPCGVGRTEVE